MSAYLLVYILICYFCLSICLFVFCPLVISSLPSLFLFGAAGSLLVQCIGSLLQRVKLHYFCTPLYFRALYYTVLYCNALQCILSKYDVLGCTVIHCDLLLRLLGSLQSKHCIGDQILGVVALPLVLIQFNFSSGFKSMLKEFMGLKSVAEKCRNGSTQQMDSGRGYFSTPTDLTP